MTRRQLFALAFVLCFTCSQSARAGLITNLATGLDASNVLIGSGGISDAHWTVQSPPVSPAAAQTVYPTNPDWFGGWIVNGPNSTWIARDANNTNNGVGTYSRTFDLTGFNVSTVSLSGSWAIDDSGILLLNGTTVGTLGGGAWGALTPFNVATGSLLLNAGLNTLSVQITGTDNFLEGVRLEGSVTGNSLASPVPEPSTLGMGGTAALLGIMFWRKRRTSR